MKTVRIGCGAGYSGDRIDAAVDLARAGNLHYLVLECLAERTIALARLEQLANPEKGCAPLVEERMAALLPLCKAQGFRIISNMGAANPTAALEKTLEVARKLRLGPLKIAVLQGADVLPALRAGKCSLSNLSADDERIISADAYLGVEELLPALQTGADVVIAGRVADPSLFLAPMVYEFGWKLDDWDRLGRGTVLAHLLECGAQVSGGYFADPVYKEVPELENPGFPLAEADANGDGFIGKTPGSGGLVDLRTCKEQLLYEIDNPAAYLTPDVTADFSAVRLREAGRNIVAVSGGGGRSRPQDVKVVVGIRDGYLGEAFVSFAGHHAVERARMAGDILEARFRRLKLNLTAVMYNIVGVDALHGPIGQSAGAIPYEVMLRVAVKSADKRDVQQAMQEAEALWLNGPGGIGGVRKFVVPVVALQNTTIPRNQLSSYVIVEEVC